MKSIKSITFVLLLIWSLGYAQFALSDCFYPKMKVGIPNGSTATDLVTAAGDLPEIQALYVAGIA